jgi:CheY-like chemotaxis protein
MVTSKRVLIFDDEPALLEPLVHQLREAGLEPELSQSFPAFLQRLNSESDPDFAAFLVDMDSTPRLAFKGQGHIRSVVNGMNVVEVLVESAIARATNRRIPIFITSALHADPGDLEAIRLLSERYGAEIRFIPKGLRTSQLRRSGLKGDLPGTLRVNGLVDVEGNPLQQDGSAHKLIVGNVQDINAEFMKAIRRNPELIRSLAPREFEEFVAHMLEDVGYQVELTPVSKDGGFDIYAARRDGVGKFLYLVECKAYAEDNPVGIGIVRALHGVVNERQASAGMIATTSRFTRGARELERKLPYRLSLNDFGAVSQWVEDYWTRKLMV